MGINVGSETLLDARDKLALNTPAHQQVFVVHSARRPQVQNGDVFESMGVQNVAFYDGRRRAAEVTVNAAEFCGIAVAIGSALGLPSNHIIFTIIIQLADQVGSVREDDVAQCWITIDVFNSYKPHLTSLHVSVPAGGIRADWWANPTLRYGMEEVVTVAKVSQLHVDCNQSSEQTTAAAESTLPHDGSRRNVQPVTMAARTSELLSSSDINGQVIGLLLL